MRPFSEQNPFFKMGFLLFLVGGKKCFRVLCVSLGYFLALKQLNINNSIFEKLRSFKTLAGPASRLVLTFYALLVFLMLCFFKQVFPQISRKMKLCFLAESLYIITAIALFEESGILTLNGPGHFRILSKIWC